MTTEPMNKLEPTEEALADENTHLALDLSKQELPLEMALRSTALTLAIRHTGDRTVKEGNLYQQLKMDNKLGNALTVNDVIYVALIFERFLWGEWSKGLAADAMDKTLNELDEVMKREVDARFIDPEPAADRVDDPPIRPHGE